MRFAFVLVTASCAGTPATRQTQTPTPTPADAATLATEPPPSADAAVPVAQQPDEPPEHTLELEFSALRGWGFALDQLYLARHHLEACLGAPATGPFEIDVTAAGHVTRVSTHVAGNDGCLEKEIRRVAFPPNKAAYQLAGMFHFD